MKREAVQEERQRGAKMLPKQTESDLNQANSVRDLTVERLMEAEQKSETRSGDNAIPYLRVGANSVVQAEYKVCASAQNVSSKYIFFANTMAKLSFLVSCSSRGPFHTFVKW